VKAVGAVLVPLNVPLNPSPIDAFGAIVAFHDRFVAVTFALPGACAQVALHPSLTR
jgi:hypothetical protein